MAYIVEVPDREGVLLVMAQSGRQMGVINGSADEWYWQIFGQDVVFERDLESAKENALIEAGRNEWGLL
jgi:hypothetical protein